jgi:V8-like Glu-specific endopeptidase
MTRPRSAPTISSFQRALAAIGFAAALALPAAAQRAPMAAEHVPLRWASATQEAPARSGVIAERVVHVEGARSMRLLFDAIELAPGSVLRLTSLTDGARQHLNATTARQWRQTSAYFNGSAVLVELIAAEGSRGNRVALREVRAGRADAAPESQCGASDDRVPSFAPNRARLVDIGCTANLMAEGCFTTAGHCLENDALVDVIEFNVPPSNANGSIVHPPPSDQYVPTENRRYSDEGQGLDWGVFTVFANTETGLTPLEAQGAGLALAAGLPALRERVEITGYGVDSGVANQTQQVSTGRITQVKPETHQLFYRSDTEGGNSGSAVLVAGQVAAIHTNGGCRVRGRGANNGTLVTEPDFKISYGLVCGGTAKR